MTFEEIFRKFDGNPFPEPSLNNVIYAVGVRFNGHFVPFYIGETSRSIAGRIGDYVSAQPRAATDFKVGETVKALRKKALPDLKQEVIVEVKFEKANSSRQERRREESCLMREVRQEFNSMKFLSPLLNDKRVNYNARNPTQEEKNRARKEIAIWVEGFLRDLEKCYFITGIKRA